ncbi:MAG: AAA family ATPase [Acidobacteria bacterium]|nr:AAA family ATPase [Acidobacteriota bacterium]
MSFHFRRLRLKDWLVYGGETEIELPDFDKGRNLVVVNGQNGFGKTSLLRGLSFVFDGRGSRADLIELWNERARSSKEGSLEVGIEFLHAGRVCKVIRGAHFKPWGDTVSVTPWVKLLIDDREEADQVADKIEELLPQDCLEFVFFDGAEISRYAQKQHQAGVREAIEKVLGVPAVRNLRHDLDRLINDLEDEQEGLLSSSQQAETLVREIEELKDEQEKYQERRRELVEKKQSLEETKKELEAEAEGIEAIERERNELQEKLGRRASLGERRSELDSGIRQLIAETPLALLEQPLQQVVEELRAKQQPSGRKDRLVAQIRVLRDLLETEAEHCLCGRDIDDEARNKLSGELGRIEKLVGESQSQSEGAMTDLLDLSALLKSISARKREPEELIDKRAHIDTQLEELETDIARLRGQLEGHELATVKELYEQIGQITRQIDEKKDQIETIDRNIERNRTVLIQKQRELDEIGAGNEQARGVTRTLAAARKMLAAVSELVDRLIEQKRTGIEDRATEIFRQITNKPMEYEGIRVNPDYTLEVVRKDGSVVENTKLSAGEKEVVAYSFITALNLSSRDPAPFVMDTPFGHLDSGHRAGLLRSLPKLDVQAILLATDRDLPADERDAIDGSICREFTLRRDQPHATTAIEES